MTNILHRIDEEIEFERGHVGESSDEDEESSSEEDSDNDVIVETGVSDRAST